MLTDYLTLRTTEQWQGYDDIVIIPEVYGINEITPIPYDASGTRFVLANHACKKVLRVIVDNYLVKNWQLVNSVDNTGHPVAFLNFTKPVSGTIQATVHGKDLFNVADIITDFCTNLSQKSLKALQILFHSAQKYELAGVLDEKITERSAIDLLAQNIGFSWNATAEKFGYIFPNQPSISQELIPEQAECTADIIDLYNVLTVDYDYSYAQSKYRRSITLVNYDSIKKYGKRKASHSAQWVKNLGDAYDIGVRFLQYYSQPVWQGTLIFDINNDIKTGEWLSITHPYLPISSVFIKSVNNNGLDIRCAFEGVLKDTQLIETESTATLFEPEIKERVISEGEERVISTNTQNTSAHNIKQRVESEATFNVIGNGLGELFVVDERRQPLSGASVSVDGGAKKVTDAAGKVVIPIGTIDTPYTFIIEHPNYETMEYRGVWSTSNG